MNNSPCATYEEGFGPVSRRMRRIGRAARWSFKGLLGRRRDILVEINWRLGDELMALPVFEALAHQYPEARIGVITAWPDLFDGNPFVHVLNPKNPTPDRYLCLRSGPRQTPRIEHYARLAGVPVPMSRPRLYGLENVSPPAPLPSERPLVALCTGASWRQKRWPLERWQALAARLKEYGCGLVELGSAGEAIGAGTDLAGRTTIREAAAVLHRSDLLICCDSGLMHLGLAANTRVLALFGPTDPSILVPEDERLDVIVADRACAGCWNRETQMTKMGPCPRDFRDCLDIIDSEQVAAGAIRLLSLK